MGGYHENRVRQALLTVRDADVLSEMAAGWRASIGQLNEADDKIRRAIRGLREGNQFGDATRGSAIEAFREMRDYIEVQRNKLGQTARALEAAGGALSQAAATVHRWNMAGDPVAPGPAPVADPNATDQAPYLAAVTLHGQQTAGYHQAVASREEEARQLMETLERVFARSEDKIRDQHGIPRETSSEPPPAWPVCDWPGPRPEEPVDPGWPELPVFPPVEEGDPRDPETSKDPKRPEGPVRHAGPAPVSSLPTTTGHHGPHGVVHGSAPDSAGSFTSVAGSSQSGVAFQGSAGAAASGSFAASLPGSAPTSGSAGLAGMNLSSMSGAMGAAARAGAAGGAAAGRMGGAGAGGAGTGRAGGSRGASGRAAGTSAGAGRSGPGGKGSQRAAGAAKSASSARSGSAGGAGGRGGRKKGQKRDQSDVFATDEHWLDGEGTSPDVLR